MSLNRVDYDKVLGTARDAFNSGKTLPLEFRLAQLQNFQRMMVDKFDDITNAVAKDLRKSRGEAGLYELGVVTNEIHQLIRDLKKLASPEKLPLNLLASLDSAYILKQPYGVVLILAPWNYPFLLSLQPLAGAIAAGNCVILKPSEVSGHSAKLMAEILPEYLDTDCYHVVQGDVEDTKELLKNKFDYIFFTGSTNVGKSVMTSAANNLTPVTLELGGKSPCYIDESADFGLAAKRILWGKTTNCGQVCIAPDYVLCSKAAESTFVKVANKVLKEWYGNDLQGNMDISRIINERHCRRLKGLLDRTKGEIVFGGKSDIDDLWIEPTIVVDVQKDDPLMEDEIFGPILPIVTVTSPEEAIKFINSKPRPLALYVFSKNDKMTDKIVHGTTSGGVCINDVMWQAGWSGLPFGGVGDSGMGNYHGKHSFETFSHHRGVLKRSFGAMSEKLGEARYPPYSDQKLKFFRMILKYFDTFNVTGGGLYTHILAALVGAAIITLYYTFIQ